MKGDSQPSKRPVPKAQNPQKRKIQKCSNKLFACSIQEFQFNLPCYSMPITLRNIGTPVDQSDDKEEVPLQLVEDYRRQSIKQKIKFRVKQEMWSMIKKIFEKPVSIDPPPILDARTEPNP